MSSDQNHPSNPEQIPPEPIGTIERPIHPYDGKLGTLYLPSREEHETLEIGGKKHKLTRREYPEGYQNYICPKCRHPFSQGISGKGVTPMFMGCRNDTAAGECGGAGASTGRAPEPTGDCRAEWFNAGPTLLRFYGKFDPGTLHHCLQGGLAYRPADVYVCGACHAPIKRSLANRYNGEPMCGDCMAKREPNKGPILRHRRNVRTQPPKRQIPGRNDPCHCGKLIAGNAVKFKNCCGRN